MEDQMQRTQPARRAIAALACIALALGGCATTGGTGAQWAPIVDLKGGDPTRYQADLAECQAYAAQQAGAAEQAMAGAVAGAIFGALLAAAAGGGYSRNQHAGVGAVVGAAGGIAQGETDQRSVTRRCLLGRGYSVLN
jgi:uncharacterized protein YcfJ